MKLMNFLKNNLLLILLTILIGGSGFYFLVLHPKFRVTHAPKLLKAVVVVKTNKLDYATNDRLIVTPDDDPVLQAVVIASRHGDNEPTYFSLSKHLKIDGKMIPETASEHHSHHLSCHQRRLHHDGSYGSGPYRLFSPVHGWLYLAGGQ